MMRSALLALALCCAGCAATSGGGLWGDHAPKWARDLAAGRRDSALVVASLDTLDHLDTHATVVSVSDSFAYSPEDSAFWARRAAEPNLSAQLQAAYSPQATAAVTLEWTMPRLKANGDTLSSAPLDYEVAYSTQSRTYVAHSWAILTDPDSAAFYWPAVVAEAAPLIVASGTAVPGAHVAWPALPVVSWDQPFSWWVRTRQRPNGEWSLWSRPPVTRKDNQ